MKNNVISTAIIIMSMAAISAAQIPFDYIPNWLSVEDSTYGTGCDLGDINRDGLFDLAVSNGNDMAMMPNYVYINEMGVIPTSASLISGDSLYSGHCEFGDVNNDSYPDIMVANYISPDWRPGSVQIYFNDAGNLEGLPSWVCADSIYCFHATFGDPDGDGDLDLACATGEAYHNYYRPNLIYFNNDGVLETTPSWESADSDAAYDAKFVDIDNDGDQDLAILTSGGPVKIYYNEEGTIQTLPGWVSEDNDNGNSFDFADLNGDGYLDMGVANNTQLGGSGLFKIYYSISGGLPTSADWQSSSTGYGSEAVFCDVDADSDQDFITGRWFGLVYIYLNIDGLFNTIPDWQCDSEYELVVENIVFGDLNYIEDSMAVETFATNGQQKLFYLNDRYVQNIGSVRADGQMLALSEYCYSLHDAWISLRNAPESTVTISYETSRNKDMAVSNWGGSTYIFCADNPSGIFDGFVRVPRDVELHQAYPNPFNARTNISFSLVTAGHVGLNIYDLTGRFITILTDADYAAGNHTIAFDASDLASGLYFYRLNTENYSDTKKMLLIK